MGKKTTWRLFPLFLKLHGRLCLIVGGGKIGEAKIAGLLSTGAKIQVVSPEVTPRIAEWYRGRQVRWLKRRFRRADLAGVYMVIAATSSNKVHREVYQEAQRRGILCNIVDVPGLCDFYYGSVVQRGDLQIAISTAGASPSLAKRLRKQFEREFGPDYGQWLKALAKHRQKIRRTGSNASEKVRLLEELSSETAYLEYKRRGNDRQRVTG